MHLVLEDDKPFNYITMTPDMIWYNHLISLHGLSSLKLTVVLRQYIVNVSFNPLQEKKSFAVKYHQILAWVLYSSKSKYLKGSLKSSDAIQTLLLKGNRGHREKINSEHDEKFIFDYLYCGGRAKRCKETRTRCTIANKKLQTLYSQVSDKKLSTHCQNILLTKAKITYVFLHL